MTPSSYTPLNTITINIDALDHNFSHLTSLIPDQPLFPVLKSNAYGHGITLVAKQCAKRKPPLVIVENIPEYNHIKKIYPGTILIMGESSPSNYRTLNHRRIHITVGSIELLKSLAQTHIPFSLHLFLDTGMSREGILLHELPEALSIINQSSLHLAGYTTHLAMSEDTHHPYTQQQYKRFEEWLGILIRWWQHPRRIHCTNTWAADTSPPWCTARRAGKWLYGLHPWRNHDIQPSRTHDLRLALSRSATITKTQDYPEGSAISYNASYITKTATRLAVLPCWFFEWLPRCWSGKLIGIHKNGLCFQRWSICMNTSIWEVPSQAAWGDTIHLLVPDQTSPSSLYAWARATQMLPSDILVHINQWLRRSHIHDNQI